ncbi:hypothetical protein [Xylella fastidiosa]|uniref:hypothetical protein n=1 Tax=Xylella fastidiosa TaxID=2371 RepID=UPI003AFB47E1
MFIQTGYGTATAIPKNAISCPIKTNVVPPELARAWLSTANITPQQRQNFYNTFITPQSQAAKLPIPEQYDPEAFDQEAKARIAMTQTGQSAQPYSLAPGARRYDANNQLVAEAPLQEKPHYDADRADSYTILTARPANLFQAPHQTGTVPTTHTVSTGAAISPEHA